MARTVIIMREGPVRSRASAKGVVLEQEVIYQVKVDTLTEDRLDIINNTDDLPKAGSSVYGGLLCKSVDLRVVSGNGRLYMATAQFSSEVPETQDPISGGVTSDPTTWVPQAEIEFDPYEEVLTKDLDNKPILNAAGDPLETGITVINRIPTRSFIQYEAIDYQSVAWTPNTAYRVGQYVSDGSWKFQCMLAGTSGTVGPASLAVPAVNQIVGPDGTCAWKTLPNISGPAVTIDQIEDRCDTTNLTTFLNRQPGTLLLEVTKATIGTYFGIRLWRVEYKVRFKKDGWDEKTIEHGLSLYRHERFGPRACGWQVLLYRQNDGCTLPRETELGWYCGS